MTPDRQVMVLHTVLLFYVGVYSCYLTNFTKVEEVIKKLTVEVYKAISYKIFGKEIIKYEMCCINTHLNVNPFTFNTDSKKKTAYANYCT